MMRRPPRRAGYFMRQRLDFRNYDGSRAVEPYWRTDMLVELTRPELRDEEAQYGPVGTRYKRVSAAEAHGWVRRGNIHGTGLYTDIDGRIRYAEGECVE